ncbi:TetR/AcrR family transcriptional regulator [Streptomyces caniscabiei]|uniref:TetR/AcrR family transcriptional regulator n=1 Tax=Streptomyces caniscabiei TaxID=2746961 RepID=UPI001F3CA8AC|nr:TetR/AcrR family transcriptional regulator [Streptomyces caniscabiei]
MPPESQDRRVRRSRAALMEAAVRLVSQRGTTAVPVTDLTEAADVSRKLLYLHYGDRDALLVAAAVDLVTRELLPRIESAPKGPQPRALEMARHFAEHRAFYRAMLTGSCAFAMTRALHDLFGSFMGRAAPELFEDVAADTAQDLAAFVAGGAIAVVNDWLINSDDPLDPEELTARLNRLRTALTGIRSAPVDEAHDR